MSTISLARAHKVVKELSKLSSSCRLPTKGSIPVFQKDKAAVIIASAVEELNAGLTESLNIVEVMYRIRGFIGTMNAQINDAGESVNSLLVERKNIDAVIRVLQNLTQSRDRYGSSSSINPLDQDAVLAQVDFEYQQQTSGSGDRFGNSDVSFSSVTVDLAQRVEAQTKQLKQRVMEIEETLARLNSTLKVELSETDHTFLQDKCLI